MLKSLLTLRSMPPTSSALDWTISSLIDLQTRCTTYFGLATLSTMYLFIRLIMPHHWHLIADETIIVVSLFYLHKLTKQPLITLLGLCSGYLYVHMTNSSYIAFDQSDETLCYLHHYTLFLFLIVSYTPPSFTLRSEHEQKHRELSNQIDKKLTSELSPEKMILGISHDANNLLHSLLANINLLELEMKSLKHWTEFSKGLLHSTASSAEHLRYLITQVLDLSLDNKQDSHMITNKISSTEFNITDPLRRLRAMVLPECKRKGLRLEVRLEEVTPIQVKMDEDRLMQILLNLVGNAIKFTEKGEISVGVAWRTNKEVRLEEELDEEAMEVCEDDSFGVMPVAQKVRKMAFSPTFVHSKPQKPTLITENEDARENRFRYLREQRDKEGELIIVIRDTGCGISEQDIGKLFSKGEQISNGTNRGKGIGLWYVKHILQQMQDRIQVKSQLKIGTRFSIKIPCTAVSFQR